MGDEDGREWIDLLEDDSVQSSTKIEYDRDLAVLRGSLDDALKILTEREKKIIVDRKLRDEPRTLESLGGELGLSKERIRQLENQALSKLRRRLESKTGNLSKVFV